MINLADVASQIVVIFLLISLGYILRITGTVNHDIRKGLSSIVLNVTIPATIIYSFDREFDLNLLNSAIIVLIVSFIVQIALVFAGRFIFKKNEPNKQKILNFGLAFANCGFMGYPVMKSILPLNGVFLTSIYVSVFNLLQWTLGVSIYNKKQMHIRNAIFNPGIIALIIGLPFFIFPISIPQTISTALGMVSDMNSPLSMIAVGIILGEGKALSMFKDMRVYLLSSLRLLVVPIVVCVVLVLINVNMDVLIVCTVISGMPVAATTAILAEKYDADSFFASQCVFVSTLLSCATIPLITFIASVL